MSVRSSVLPARSTLSAAISSHLSQRLFFPVLSLTLPGLVIAAPEGGNVVAGSAVITSPDANTTLITQTSTRAAIDWQRFSIGETEYVQFSQPGSNSIALNRVVGGNPSDILGNLSANGQVFLVNPNGIYFGSSATVNVGGIVASVLDISNEDFMAGNYRFAKGENAPAYADVINDGAILADGGYVVLLGDYVSNNHLIQARMGSVALAAGNRITLDIKADG
ncbi:MAG TPA: filamentous hemagglutinin N-terminal domain-containing protein, partial [Thiotrichales bacterium]|nr:filamentous hemagglutinin N-terminal domain-containing protein [Thiotrichales bacterium]